MTASVVVFALLALWMPLESTGAPKVQDPPLLYSSKSTNDTQLKCDKRAMVLTRTHGVVRTPGYPKSYQHNQRCTWHINVPRGYQIRVRFRKNFSIEQSRDCGKDFIMLSTTKHFRNPMSFCGSVRPHSFITPKNNLWIRFQSDNESSGKGFHATYLAIDENECERQVCTFPSLCRNTVGSYACDCPDGFENKGKKDSARCVDTDECKSGIVRCDHKCINTEGSYHCQCRKGYRLASDGRRCRANSNECGRGNGGCSHFCEKVRSTIRCKCPSGFVLHSDKKKCIPEISFNQQQYRVHVSEKAAPGTVVVKVKATSYPLQQDITYAIKSENLNRPTTFVVDASTGSITLTGGLDRELTSDYLLEVEARYQASNNSGEIKYRTANSYVVIYVLDQNDNAPFFMRSSYHVHIPCNASVGKTVYRVRAQDRDNGYNARLRYRLLSKGPYFSISSNSGKIKVTKELRQFCAASPLRSFKLSVQARDRGSVPLSAQVYIHVIITPPGKLSRPVINENLWTTGSNMQRDQTADKSRPGLRVP